MERIKYYIEKYKIIMIITIILVLLVIFFSFKNVVNGKDNVEVSEPILLSNNISDEKLETSTYKVDIKGYIENPGVYTLDEGSRVIDVINMAGGLKEGANTEYLNLSKKIADEMVIIIYSNSEVEKYKSTEKPTIYIEYKCECPDNINDACINSNDIVNTNGIEEIINQDSKKVSINSATIKELTTLPGIGESKAKAIIEYRTKNGSFKSIEEIKKVSGIGDAAYSKIKDFIEL